MMTQRPLDPIGNPAVNAPAYPGGSLPKILAGNLLLALFFVGVIAVMLLYALFAALGRLRTLCRGAVSRDSGSRPQGAALLLLAALLSTACGQSAESGPAALAEVRYVEVSPERVTLTRELPGRVSAFKVSEVRPQVGGIILTRLFEEGADVMAGQALYQIDPALYQAAYNNARANLGRAQANEEAARLLAERYTRLVRSNSVSRQERDDALAAYRQLRAEIEACRETLESAAINLGYTRITAPVGGRIGRSSVTEGALVTQNQGQPLATIQQISPVYVDVTQSSTQMLRLKRAFASGALQSGGKSAAKVRLLLEDGSPYLHPGCGAWLEGDLLFSDITVDESTGSVSIRARFDNPEGLLLPGMYVRAILEEGVVEDAVLVPQRSVTRDARNRPQVYVLTPLAPDPDGRSQAQVTRPDSGQDAGRNAGQALGRAAYEVSARTVEIDRDHEGRWLLGSGLARGERLLVDGLQKARPGQTVMGTRLAEPAVIQAAFPVEAGIGADAPDRAAASCTRRR